MSKKKKKTPITFDGLKLDLCSLIANLDNYENWEDDTEESKYFYRLVGSAEIAMLHIKQFQKEIMKNRKNTKKGSLRNLSKKRLLAINKEMKG